MSRSNMHPCKYGAACVRRAGCRCWHSASDRNTWAKQETARWCSDGTNCRHVLRCGFRHTEKDREMALERIHKSKARHAVGLFMEQKHRESRWLEEKYEMEKKAKADQLALFEKIKENVMARKQHYFQIICKYDVGKLKTLLSRIESGRSELARTRDEICQDALKAMGIYVYDDILVNTHISLNTHHNKLVELMTREGPQLLLPTSSIFNRSERKSGKL